MVFPDTALNKVINNLEKAKVSYIVTNKGVFEQKKEFKKINQYFLLLEKGRETYDIVTRLDALIDKINQLPMERI